MRARASALWVVALVVAAANAHAGSRQDDAAAEALFQEGRKLVDEGKLTEGCEKFAASQRLSSSPGTILNLADCYERAGRTATAWATFREAIEVARHADRPDRERFARDRAAELEPKLARLKLVVDATRTPGLVVRQDSREVDPATVGLAVPIDPGPHVIEASAAGRVPFRATVTLKPGKTQSLEIAPLPAVPSPAPGSPHRALAHVDTHEGQASGASQRRLAWVVGGAGVVSVGLGTVFGLMARSKWSDAMNGGHCRGTICDPAGGELAGDARRFGNVSTATFVVGGVALAAAVVLFLTAPVESAPTARAHGLEVTF